MNSITTRWIRGSLLFTVAVVLIAETLLVYFITTGYYNGAENALASELRSQYGMLSSSSSASSASKRQRMRQTVEQFTAKEKYQMMLIGYDGTVVSTSSGVVPKLDEPPTDVRDMLAGASSAYTTTVGNNEHGERVMAVTMRTPYSSDGVVAMRLVTSLKQVDNSIQQLIWGSLSVVVVIILASVVSGMYFIRSIVIPLQKIEHSASQIAQGDFETRISVDSQDEVGRLCQTINHMADELSKSDQMKNDFISSVSHELRTPLTSIKGWTETIGRVKNPSDPIFRRGVAIITSETDRLYDMVEELLDFSRMQNGLQLDLELLDLAAEVDEAVMIAEQRARHQDVQLVYEAPQEPVPVTGARNRIKQVLLNVLDNAVKYSSAGGKVVLTVEMHGTEAEVSVQDEGAGIPEEDLKLVKKKFHKAKGALRGSGIGLAVADEIMSAHNGRLDIKSKLGEGTYVGLVFPKSGTQNALELPHVSGKLPQ